MAAGLPTLNTVDQSDIIELKTVESIHQPLDVPRLLREVLFLVQSACACMWV